MQVKISVVVPTYKRPQLLRKCLDHLVNQTLEKQLFEIIVVSDGQDIESLEIVVEYSLQNAPNLIFLSLPSRKGPAAARNLGWKNAGGGLIAFTDDDCLPDKNWLQSIMKRYNYEPEIAYTGKVIVPVSDNPTDFELNTQGLETGDFVTANCVVTKSTLEAVGGFDEAFAMAWREDSDLEFKLLLRNVPIVKLNEAMVIHPVRKAQWGISIKEQKKTMYNALLYKKYPALYREKIKSCPSWRYYLIILFFIIFVVASFMELNWISWVGLVGWFFLTIAFAVKRLSATRKDAAHIFEMIVTSAVIPFLSVYWTLYGAIKYRVLFF